MSRSNPQPPNPPPRAPGGPVQGPPQFMHHYANPQATQVPSVPLHYRQHPAYSPVLVHHPPPDPMEIMSQRFAQSVRDILSAQQAHNETRMNRLETNIQRLSSDISDSRRDTRDSTANYIGKIAEMLVNSHEIQLARLKRMELVLGMGPDMKDEKSLLARFDLLSFAVEEFLERVKDPEANLPEGPLRHDMATSPIKRGYADAGILPRTPSPSPRLSSVAVGPSPPHDDTFSEDSLLSENKSLSTIVGDESLPNIFGKPLAQINLNKGLEQDESWTPANEIDLVPRATSKHTFAAASPVTSPLVPVDWDDQSPSPESFAFNPDQSTEGMKPYSTLPIRPPPSAGTVTSLRHATFGDQFSGPSSVSTPYRSTSVHPMSPALSMSPSTSPRPPTPLPADTGLSVPHDASLAATCRAPPETQTSYPGTREHSVGAHRSSNAALPRDIPSRSSTVERDGNVHPESPSADTIREVLSVSNMMSPHSGTHSNVASPTRPFPPTEDEDVVPSSVTPSPMLGAQIHASSPPRLTLDIPVTVPAPSYPSAGDLFDPFMSPLSSTNPSAAPSPSPPPKDERTEERIPTTSSPPSGRPTVSGLRLRAPDLGEPAENVPQKRKLESDSTKQPPVKRPRGRPSKQHAGPSVKQEKGKKRKKLNEPVWPEIIPEDASPAEFVGKFIGCDNCERWFHYTCMAIVRDDPRVDGTFHCPFCVAAHPPLEGTDDPTAEQCKRPDCPTKGADFEVDGVFGRYTKLDSTRGRLVYWLMRWKGYPWSEATWQTFAPDEAIEEFYKRASAEGFDREDDSVSCIMLAEAQAGGAMDPSDP